jgi:hypothetical protein
MLDRADERRVKQDQATNSVRARNQTRSKRTTDKEYKRQLARIPAEPEHAVPAFDDSLFTHNLHQLLTDLSTRSEAFGDNIEDYLVDLFNETSLLNAVSTIVDSAPAAATVMRIASLDARGQMACLRLQGLYRTLFEKEFNCKVTASDYTFNKRDERTSAHMHFAELLVEGSIAALLAPLEAGTHLFVSPNESYQPVVVMVRSADKHPEHFENLPPVLRIYAEGDTTLDLRTQLLSIGKLGSSELRAFVLAALPRPEEFN